MLSLRRLLRVRRSMLRARSMLRVGRRHPMARIWSEVVPVPVNWRPLSHVTWRWPSPVGRVAERLSRRPSRVAAGRHAVGRATRSIGRPGEARRRAPVRHVGPVMVGRRRGAEWRGPVLHRRRSAERRGPVLHRRPAVHLRWPARHRMAVGTNRAPEAGHHRRRAVRPRPPGRPRMHPHARAGPWRTPAGRRAPGAEATRRRHPRPRRAVPWHGPRAWRHAWPRERHHVGAWPSG